MFRPARQIDATTLAAAGSRPADAPFWLLPALACLLLLSGMCALVYQVLWLRLLSLTFGVTTYAASTVLASFMGGLALGSILAGRLADRARHPLRLFGAAELLIGLCAILTPMALSGVHGVYMAVFPSLPDSLLLATIVRFVLSFVILLVPTALMGATLPIVIKSSVTRLEAIGASVGLLYASNTTGAIVGALLAGLYLIPQLGLNRSFLLAASVNAFVGLTALALSVRRSRTLESDPAPAIARSGSRSAESWWPIPMLVLAVFAVSGFASLALEVIWFRVLVIFLGPTSYSFTLMLASVLAGIALGSFLITPLMRWRLDWLQVLAILQVGAALVALRSFSDLRHLGQVPEWLQPLSRWPAVGYLLPTVSCVFAILPTAVFLGLAFPVGLRLWVGDAGSERHTAERIGLFYSLNVCGGVLGSVAAGFLLLPRLGSRVSLIAVAALFLLSGLALQILLMKRRPLWTLLSAAAALAFVVQTEQVPDPLETARRLHSAGKVFFQEEGVQTTVSVAGDVGSRVLFLDGRHQANDAANMVFVHRRIGLLPAVLHPHPRRALVVGLGGGVTPGGLSQYPGLELDVIELSEGVVRAAPFFSHVNFDLLGRSNVRTRLDDGRNFLLRVQRPYDVITADAILPQHFGANNLNSVEYFRLVRDALAPDGVALHWNGGSTATEYKLILRAFVDAFPHATLWGDGTLMVGSKQPLTLSRRRIETLLAEPTMRSVLALMHVETVDHLIRMFRASPAGIRAYLGEGPILTDDKPALEYFASLPQDERDLTIIERDARALVQP